MTREERLKKDAMEGVMWRGHRMCIRWYKGDTRRIFTRYCVRCKAYVQVNLDPQPNEIEIGGTAVALNCGEVENG